MNTAQSICTRVLRLILERERISKAEICATLGFSRPTVIAAVAQLEKDGIVRESGSYESTGGRRAKALSAVPSYRTFVGLDMTANHVSIVALDWAGNLVAETRQRLSFDPSRKYLAQVKSRVGGFLRKMDIPSSRIPGVGISLPGILSDDRRMLVRSHALQIENLDLAPLAACFPHGEVVFENDANSAALAECPAIGSDSIYLSLSNTVGGACIHQGALYLGDNRRAGEFGHMILHPNGRRCYCGKNGCADAYLSALQLAKRARSLEDFFIRLERGEERAVRLWGEYLDDLAVLVSNLRMAHDCGIVLGGYVGAFLEPYLSLLRKKVSSLDRFETCADYVTVARRAREASAVGMALQMRDRMVEQL